MRLVIKPSILTGLAALCLAFVTQHVEGIRRYSWINCSLAETVFPSIFKQSIGLSRTNLVDLYLLIPV